MTLDVWMMTLRLWLGPFMEFAPARIPFPFPVEHDEVERRNTHR